MLVQVHDHIVSELGESSSTDTIFVLTAIVFNLIVLAINSGVSHKAKAEGPAATYDIILAFFIAMTVLLNTVAVAALILGSRTRHILLSGLVAMYRDNEVDKYYDPLPDVELWSPLSPLRRGDRDAGSRGDRSPIDHPLYQIKDQHPARACISLVGGQFERTGLRTYRRSFESGSP